MCLYSIPVQAKPMTVKEIVSLHKSGVDDETIIQKLTTTKTQISLTVKEIVALKRKGISDRVIRVMLYGESPHATSPAPKKDKTTVPSGFTKDNSEKPVKVSDTHSIAAKEQQPTPTPGVPSPQPSPTSQITQKRGDKIGNSHRSAMDSTLSQEPQIQVSLPKTEVKELARPVKSPPVELTESPTVSLPQRSVNTGDKSAAQNEDISMDSGEFLFPDDTRPSRIVKITSTPSGAQVFMDGQSKGVTPFYSNIIKWSGKTLTLRKKFYKDLNVKLDIMDSQPENLHFTLMLEHPIVKVWFSTANAQSVSHFKWVSQSCNDKIKPPNALSLIPFTADVKTPAVLWFTVDDTAPGMREFDKTALKSCLEFYVWFMDNGSDRSKRYTSEQVDLNFIVSDIPLSTTEITKVELELQFNSAYPRGIRIILHSPGNLFRIN